MVEYLNCGPETDGKTMDGLFTMLRVHESPILPDMDFRGSDPAAVKRQAHALHAVWRDFFNQVKLFVPNLRGMIEGTEEGSLFDATEGVLGRIRLAIQRPRFLVAESPPGGRPDGQFVVCAA